MSVVISPSILNCDFGHFADELARISTADYVHVDVMDNHFVPNLALGLPLVEAAVHASPVPVDAHLMIEDPDRWAPVYAEAGCASVTFHAEAASAPPPPGARDPGPGQAGRPGAAPATGIRTVTSTSSANST